MQTFILFLTPRCRSPLLILGRSQVQPLALAQSSIVIPTSRDTMHAERYTDGMRSAYTVLGLVLVAVVGGAYFFLYGPNGLAGTSSAVNNIPSPVAVPFTPLVSGAKSTVTTRVNYLITSADQLNKLWKMIDATSTPPAVDFNKNAVIAVFAGQQPTTGYAIVVAKIEDSTARNVSLTLAKPSANCVEGQIVTAPYEIVAIPATTLPLAHTDQTITATCTN